MINKIVEFARLEPKIHELAIEHFDDVDQRNRFLRITALCKIAGLLNHVKVPKQSARDFIAMLEAVDKTIDDYSKETNVNFVALSELIQQIKNDTKKVSN